MAQMQQCFAEDLLLNNSAQFSKPIKVDREQNQDIMWKKSTKVCAWKRKCIIFPQDNDQPHVFWWSGKNCYSLTGKLSLICLICITIYSCFYRILLRKIIWILLRKIAKDTKSSSLLRKINSSGGMKLSSCLKSGTK